MADIIRGSNDEGRIVTIFMRYHADFDKIDGEVLEEIPADTLGKTPRTFIESKKKEYIAKFSSNYQDSAYGLNMTHSVGDNLGSKLQIMWDREVLTLKAMKEKGEDATTQLERIEKLEGRIASYNEEMGIKPQRKTLEEQEEEMRDLRERGLKLLRDSFK